MEDRVQPDRSATDEGQAGWHARVVAGCAGAAGVVFSSGAGSGGREVAGVDRYAGHRADAGARGGIGAAQRGRKKFVALRKKVLEKGSTSQLRSWLESWIWRRLRPFAFVLLEGYTPRVLTYVKERE